MVKAAISAKLNYLAVWYSKEKFIDTILAPTIGNINFLNKGGGSGLSLKQQAVPG